MEREYTIKMIAAKQRPASITSWLENTINDLLLVIKEKRLLRDYKNRERVAYSTINEYYSMIYDRLTGKYSDLLSDQSSALYVKESVVDVVDSVISSAEGDKQESEHRIDLCNRRYWQEMTKITRRMKHDAKRILHAFYNVEVLAGYNVLCEFMDEEEVRDMGDKEILSRSAPLLEENKLKFAAFYGIRRSTMQKIEEMGLSPPP